MLLDQDPASLRRVKQALRARSIACRAFTSAEAALHSVLRDRPDSLIVDVGWPDYSGLRFWERVQDELGFDVPPCLFLSARHEEAVIARAFEAGGVDVLRKPLSLGELLAKLRHALGETTQTCLRILSTSRPSSIGRFPILQEIGRGGMGVIYMVRDPGSGHRIALKTLAYKEIDMDALLRFRREIDLLTGLDHPHLVRIYEAGRSRNLFYYALEYIEGPTLEAIIRGEGPVHWQLVVDWTYALASALDYLHDRSILHRDIKPSNILLCPERGPVLIDFGLAKYILDYQLTCGEEVFGTPQFMAPELLLSDRVDGRCDLFSLGMVALEMLLGAPAIQEDSVYRVFQRLSTRDFPRARDLPQVPDALARAIDGLLEVNPKQRTQRAADYLEAIQELRSDAFIARSVRYAQRRLFPKGTEPFDRRSQESC